MNPSRKTNYKLLLLASDLLAFGAALWCAVFLRYEAGIPFFEAGAAPMAQLRAAIPYGMVVWGFSLWISRAYRLGVPTIWEFLRVGRGLVFAFLLLLAATFFYRGFSYSRAVVMMMGPIALATTMLFRALARFVWHQVLQLDPVQGAGLVVGGGRVAHHLATELSGHRADFRVIGLVDTKGEHKEGERLEGEVMVVGEGIDSLPQLLASGRFQAVMVADDSLGREEVMRIAELCLRYGAGFQVVPSIFELMLDRVEITMMGGVPLLALRQNQITGVRFVMKRVFDLALSSLLLLALSPLMLAVAIGIKLSSRGPIFFTQERVGLNGRPFSFIKFRSMHLGNSDKVHRDYVKKWIENQAASEVAVAEKDGEESKEKIFKIQSDPRIFSFGNFIRRYSLDELPQLFNVMRGDMSLIGPRPPIPYEVEAYREWHRRRFEALPGITGLWQGSGRNKLSFDEMVSLDLEYINNWSLELDLRIALKTVGVVLSGRDAY